LGLSSFSIFSSEYRNMLSPVMSEFDKPPDKQRLIFVGKQLEDGRTLSGGISFFMSKISPDILTVNSTYRL